MWRGGGLDDAPPSDNVAPTLAQVHLLGRRSGPLSFRGGRLACDVALRLCSGACFARAAFASLHVCPKRWQRLHCKGPVGVTYDSTDTRRPQSSVSERTFDTLGPRATDRIIVLMGRCPFYMRSR
jgi:hypothetical protein